jgi:Lar family restriction alleviation protein
VTDIKPCPFCGSEAIVITSSTIYWENYAVMCDGSKDGNCAGLGGSSKYDTEEEAIDKWNQRANYWR